MVRFLTIVCLVCAILVALSALASRFTIRVTIEPAQGPTEHATTLKEAKP